MELDNRNKIHRDQSFIDVQTFMLRHYVFFVMSVTFSVFAILTWKACHTYHVYIVDFAKYYAYYATIYQNS